MPWDQNFRRIEEQPWWVDPLNRTIDVFGAYSSRSPYVSPDDPRYREGQQVRHFPMPNPVSPGGVTGEGIQLNWWTLVLGGALVGAFLFGRKGR